MIADKKELHFSALQFLVDDELPSKEVLKKIFSNEDRNFKHNDTHYIFNQEVIDDDDFWIHAKYGKSIPFSPTVYNEESQEEEENPRTKKQAETTKQLFGLYSVRNRKLYLSSISKSKRKLIEDYFKKIIGDDRDIVIKPFYKSEEEFIEAIKSVEKVKFVSESNLTTPSSGVMDIFNNPKDFFGLDMPHDFTLETKFINAKPTKRFGNFLRKMINWKKTGSADSLVCVGRDENGMETVFNIDTFVQKTALSISQNEQGMIDPKEVKIELELLLKARQ